MKHAISIRQSLFLSLALLLVLTSGAILAVAAVAAGRGAGALARSAIDATEERVEGEVVRFLTEIERAVLVSRDWMRASGLGPQDNEELNALFRPMIEQLPQLSSVLVARSDGSEFSILRDPRRPDEWQNRIVRPDLWGGDALIRRWNTATGETEEGFERLDYDPRTRTYYQVAVSSAAGTDEVRWTPPTVFYITRDPGITGGAWSVDGEGDTTVVAFDLLLMDLSRITSRAEVGESGVAFALTTSSAADTARVVGLPALGTDTSDSGIRARLLSPLGRTLAPDADPALPLPSDLGVGEIGGAVEAWEEAGRPSGPVEFALGGERWWGSFRPIPLHAHTLWVGVAAREGDFVGDLLGLSRQVAGVAVFALFASIFLATRLARSFAHPLEALARSSGRIRQLDLAEPEPIRSRLTEIRGLADEQERMRTALDSFARYMPVELVRRLVARGEAARIGGSRRVITILFTDIEGFTTIAEAHTPEEVTAHLTEYFEWILDTIRAHGGEVNQLLGDGVMAYWGAPVESEAHAQDAVAAVLACQAGLVRLNDRWRERGDPPLPTRFGLATGEVVVGNVGSPSRLAYAAVGDPANLASRIEGMNRFYGTRLLVAGETRRQAGDAFEWRHVDGVRAKGKSRIVELFEPLGAVGTVAPDHLAFRDAYESALALYRGRDFVAALEALDAVPPGDRGDRSVTRLRSLAEEFIVSPPPDSWDGVTDFHIK